MNMPHSNKHKPIVSVWVSQLCVFVCECVFRSLYEMMSGRYTWEIFKCAQHFHCFHLPETSEGQSSGGDGGLRQGVMVRTGLVGVPLTPERHEQRSFTVLTPFPLAAQSHNAWEKLENNCKSARPENGVFASVGKVGEESVYWGNICLWNGTVT